MIYTVLNTARAPRGFYDARNREIMLAPGMQRHVDLDDSTVSRLEARDDLVIRPASFDLRPPSLPPPLPHPAQSAQAKPPLVVTGHFGIGDNLHQRAVMRELMKTHEVWLHTCHFELYHDLIAQGLRLVMRPTSLHAQARTIAREHGQFVAAAFPVPPADARSLHIGYPKTAIDRHGSILAAMFGAVGLTMPERPDFSLPVKPEWRQSLRERYRWDTGGKPLMVHRPIVVRREWDGRSRNPDPGVYDTLYRSIREQFFVVSIADLAVGREQIEGPHQDADVKLHAGELAFGEMAALFTDADLVFANAGFAPVLAQAVGTPVAVVYGGRESYRTTQSGGAHLAPTLPIDTINPCDCHSAKHACDKRVDVAAALPRLAEFAQAQRRRSILLFGTFYVDSPDRDGLTDLWKRLHFSLNERDCDFLAVDSQSPIRKFDDWQRYDGVRHRRMYFDFPDNIGHLSRARTTPGKDGWGRAFCKGLEIACALGYDYAVHIEGDSLFRIKVADVVAQMRREGADCMTTGVSGLIHQSTAREWVETGLMFFSTDYLRRSRFVARYDWPNRKVSPTPERYIRMQLLQKDLDSKQLRIMPWKAWRADKNNITRDNVLKLGLDWVTHQHDSAQQDVYRKFVDHVLCGGGGSAGLGDAGVGSAPGGGGPPGGITTVAGPPGGAGTSLAGGCPVGSVDMRRSLLRLNLGCGTNRLPGWENHDADVDITKPLPWPDGSVSHIVIEHCVEHVPYKAAIAFFREAHRALAPGGVLRVTVPSLQQIAACQDEGYHRFTTRWQPLGPTRRGAMHAIIYAHGHECAWNAQLMHDTLFFAGFDDIRACQPGQSQDPVLRGVEGHGRVIGDTFNQIESCTHEARKSGTAASVADAGGVPAAAAPIGIREPFETVALVIGGAECWAQDLEAARVLLAGAPVRYFYVNDHIKSFPEPGVACTLHPDKLNGHFAWLPGRRRAGLPEPDQVWSHRKCSGVTRDTASKDWGGSSGLFAIQVARREGHRRIIACGIPMTVEGRHFERHTGWHSAISFRIGWVRCREELAPYLRSMSGWTAETFGKPDAEWLR